MAVPAAKSSAAGSARTNLSDGSTIYRMDPAHATFVEGCFEPCMCPLWLVGEVRGTFVLGPIMVGNVVDFREVREINWTVGDIDNPVHTITGSGMYRRTNYGEPYSHSLDLSLSIDGGEPVSFFSDFVPVSSNDDLLDIPVSINGMFCYDTVINIYAKPVQLHEVQRYRLNNTSHYQQGCFDPCDCLLEMPRSMTGTFMLVPIFEGGTYDVYSVVCVNFNVPALQNSNGGAIQFTGFGRYTLIQGFAGPMQAMELKLSSNGGPLESFDAELENIEPTYPGISVVVDMNEQVCFDKVLSIDAAPLPRPRAFSKLSSNGPLN
jgi:hypothetical protein